MTDDQETTVLIEPEVHAAPCDPPAFPCNWVCFYGDYGVDGVWSAAGLVCAAADLPVPPDLHKAIEYWGFNYVGRVHAGAKSSEDRGRWFDTTGFELARQVSAVLPHWIVEFASEFGVYTTASGKRTGIVRADGTFVDPSEEQEAIRKAIIDEENRDL